LGSPTTDVVQQSTGDKRPVAVSRERLLFGRLTVVRSAALEGPFPLFQAPDDYRPPASRAELEVRYAAGERSFPETELSDADLSGIVLDGADFGKHSWFADANFTGASLRGTSFRECNVKCADFSDADLTGATFYGCELGDDDELPSWEW
jgi:uncharacterized protein YjbI with pentapeptide repeats